MFINTIYLLLVDIVSHIINILYVVLVVAVYTLWERRILARAQRRLGPTAISYQGLLQPFSDGFKLILKQPIVPLKASTFLFILAPIISFTLALFSWSFIPSPFFGSLNNTSLSLFYVLALSTLGIYGTLLSGWASNSRYAFLGSLRSTAQMISYEVILGLSLLPACIISSSLNFVDIVFAQQESVPFFIPLFPLFLIFCIAALAETNRAPFDLPEAESELVSGYNIEYSGIFFVLFFLAEYTNMLIFSHVIPLVFLGGFNPSSLLSCYIYFYKVGLIAFGFVIARAILPRYRFDQLMLLCWKIFLPIVLACFFFTAVVITLSV